MNEKAQGKWTGPDEINGVLHVGEGYRPAGMALADRLRTDREQWYAGDSENGESGIWGDARPGSFDPSKVYRVPVERKDEPGVFGDSQGEAGGAPPVGEFEDCGREGGPDCQNDEIDDDFEYLTAADFLRDDAVDHPNHYNDGSIECIDAIQAALTEEEFIGFCKGNALKYIWREQWKNGMEDLQKAAWYLNRATEGLEAAE